MVISYIYVKLFLLTKTSHIARNDTVLLAKGVLQAW